MTHDADGPALFTFGVDRAMQALREHAPGRNVLAVLTDSTADEWHHRWERSGVESEQVGIIECFDLMRGGTAAQTTVVSDDLAISAIERPVDAAQLRPLLDRFLDGWEQSASGTVVYLDSLGTLLADTDRETVRRLLEGLRERTDAPDSGIVASASPDCPPRAAVTFSDVFDVAVGEPSFDSDAQTAVRRLRLADPTTFGYFRSYWREAIDVLDSLDRAYVQAGQLDDETELSPRMLGATLSAFADLDALAVRADTNGPNRYDVRRYDPERAAELGLVVDSLPE